MGAYTFGMCLDAAKGLSHRNFSNHALTLVLYRLEQAHRTFSLTEFTAELNQALPSGANFSFTVESALVLVDELVDEGRVERIGGHIRLITPNSP